MADYQTWLPDLKQLGITVIAASVDMPEDAQQSVSTNKHAFPVAHSLDYQDISRRTGAFIEHERKILQAIPAVGALVGATVNGWYIKEIGWTARRAFQVRWLIENRKVVEI